MLVLGLTDKNEALLTLPDGRAIRVVMVRVSTHQAHIGFVAPLDVTIERQPAADRRKNRKPRKERHG